MKKFGMLIFCTLLLFPLYSHGASAKSFSDITPSHFALPYITTLSNKGILGGYPDGTFRPNQIISRAEASKIAVNISIETGKIDDISEILGGPSFQDISTNQWYFYYVSLASKYGLVSGYQTPTGTSTGTFGPDGSITRAEAAKVLFLASYYPHTATVVPHFKDVTAADWYSDIVISAYNLSMIDGYTDASGVLTGDFGPNDPITRGAFAKMAATALEPVDRFTYPTQSCEAVPQQPATLSGTVLTGTVMTSSGSLLETEANDAVPTKVCTKTPTRVILSCSINPDFPHCDLMKKRKLSPFKFLQRYPFRNPAIELVEGFSVYDGNLDDQVGARHSGIDYALPQGESFIPFDVYAMHPGYAAQGSSPSWGKYVIIFFPEKQGGHEYATLYSHLEGVPSNLPWYKVGGNYLNYSFMDTGTLLGHASTTGDTKNNPQLHIEIHDYDTEYQRVKRDIYHIYDRLSSGKYPKVGEVFTYDSHHFMSNYPDIQ